MRSIDLQASRGSCHYDSRRVDSLSVFAQLQDAPTTKTN